MVIKEVWMVRWRVRPVDGNVEALKVDGVLSLFLCPSYTPPLMITNLINPTVTNLVNPTVELKIYRLQQFEGASSLSSKYLQFLSPCGGW